MTLCGISVRKESGSAHARNGQMWTESDTAVGAMSTTSTIAIQAGRDILNLRENGTRGYLNDMEVVVLGASHDVDTNIKR